MVYGQWSSWLVWGFLSMGERDMARLPISVSIPFPACLMDRSDSLC